MLDNDDDEARATSRIVDTETGKTVGVLYVWEDGVEQPFWFEGEKTDVILVGLSHPKHCEGFE